MGRGIVAERPARAGSVESRRCPRSPPGSWPSSLLAAPARGCSSSARRGRRCPRCRSRSGRSPPGGRRSPGAGAAASLAAALLAFGLLVLLRLLPKHEVPPPPGWRPPPAPPAAGAPGPAAAARSRRPLAPRAGRRARAARAGCRSGTTHPARASPSRRRSARLLLWRDGIPATAEPLLPLAPVGAHAPALATLAADVSHLSGLDPAPSLLLVVVAAAGLAARRPLRAARHVGSAAGRGPRRRSSVSPPRPGPARSRRGERARRSSRSAFALPAAALLVGHASRSSAVAAGMLLAAAALAQPLLAAGAACWRPARRDCGRPAEAAGPARPGPGPRARPRGARPVAPRAVPSRRARRRPRARGAAGRAASALALGLVLVASSRRSRFGGSPSPVARGRRLGDGRAGRGRDGPSRRARARLDRLRPAARPGASRAPGRVAAETNAPGSRVRAGGSARLGPGPRRARGGRAGPLDSAGLRRRVGAGGPAAPARARLEAFVSSR